MTARMRRALWTLLVLWVLLGGSLSLLLGRAAGGGEMLMPLDDVYIHFQYARQLAVGQPYVYNPGDLPTSGATSFIYPYVLAVGYRLGFTGMALGEWALLVGWGSLLVTALGMWRLLMAWQVAWPLRAVVTGAGITGLFAWHFNSGMETGLMTMAVIWSLAAWVERRWALLAGWTALLAILRPEGSAMALLAVGLAALSHGRTMRPRERWLLLIPVLACGVQPLVNLALTGSWVATGNQSKSILGALPADSGLFIRRILGNLLRMVGEALTGIADGRFYLPPGLGVAALVGLGWVARRWRWQALLIAGWLLGVSLAISTLDNAFWHFKRYQVPLLLVLLLLAGVALSRLPRRWQQAGVVWLIVFSVIGLAQFTRFQAQNLAYVASQPLAMARWLQANTSPGSRVAVHDVGLMRYRGERPTLDLVGLTTPDAALYWRNGVGSVAELLLRTQPPTIASYGAGHGYGLAMLEDTLLLSQPVAEFSVVPDATANVALAAPTQRIVMPDYQSEAARTQSQPMSEGVQALLAGTDQADWMNVADVLSERAHDYQWSGAPTAGFLTEVHQQPTLGNATAKIEGSRRLTEGEQFTFHAVSTAGDGLLVTRVHAVGSGTLAIYVNGVLVGTRTLVYAPGQWQEFMTLIPQAQLASEVSIQTVAHLSSGEYAPASHWLYTALPAISLTEEPTVLAEFNGGAFALTGVTMTDTAQGRELRLRWRVAREVPGDTRLFVHLYRDLDQPPIAQTDTYPAGGLPTGNWITGERYDTIRLLNPIDRPEAGQMMLAIGFYDVNTQQRLAVTSETLAVVDNRLILSEETVGGG